MTLKCKWNGLECFTGCCLWVSQVIVFFSLLEDHWCFYSAIGCCLPRVFDWLPNQRSSRAVVKRMTLVPHLCFSWHKGRWFYHSPVDAFVPLSKLWNDACVLRPGASLPLLCCCGDNQFKTVNVIQALVISTFLFLKARAGWYIWRRSGRPSLYIGRRPPWSPSPPWSLEWCLNGSKMCWNDTLVMGLFCRMILLKTEKEGMRDINCLVGIKLSNLELVWNVVCFLFPKKR